MQYSSRQSEYFTEKYTKAEFICTKGECTQWNKAVVFRGKTVHRAPCFVGFNLIIQHQNEKVVTNCYFLDFFLKNFYFLLCSRMPSVYTIHNQRICRDRRPRRSYRGMPLRGRTVREAGPCKVGVTHPDCHPERSVAESKDP